MNKFKAGIQIVGINPYVSVPDVILARIFELAKKDKGAIPIKGFINEKPYRQTLVKFKGCWRLYVNSAMLKNSPKRIGEIVEISVEFDPEKRTIKPHPKWMKALKENEEAEEVFDSLSPSLKLEIAKYISSLKSEVSVENNIKKAILFLLGKGRFVGREPISKKIK